MKFLFVDDSEQFRTYLRSIVLQSGDECRELEDGTQVNEVYKTFQPDWVLLDIQMQPMDGFTAAVQLKEHYPNARFVFISNYADKKFQKKAQSLGAVALISKEKLEDLAAMIIK
jgi:CheY-like chemotaxis protein